MDKADRLILRAVQAESSRSLAELSELVGVSHSACHRRVRALEEQGVITGYMAKLDPSKLGLGLNAFVEISLNSQSREAMDVFEEAVRRFDDVLECHLMSGAADYILRIAASGIEDYDRIHRNCLSRLPGVSAMRSSFAIRRIKDWAGYPVAVA
ncbi:MAG: Lrp/AsnC family transcriptional regulator [Sphingobium sp.]